MLSINKSNYQKFKVVAKIIWEVEYKYSELDVEPEILPYYILNKLEKESLSKATKALRETLRDTLTSIGRLPDNEINEINQKLTENNLPRLKILTSSIKDIANKVLKRGSIKNIDEYYIIKEVLFDINCDINESKKNELERIICEYESTYNG